MVPAPHDPGKFPEIARDPQKGRVEYTKINAWSIADACALCAGRSSYAQPHVHRE